MLLITFTPDDCIRSRRCARRRRSASGRLHVAASRSQLQRTSGRRRCRNCAERKDPVFDGRIQRRLARAQDFLDIASHRPARTPGHPVRLTTFRLSRLSDLDLSQAFERSVRKVARTLKTRAGHPSLCGRSERLAGLGRCRMIRLIAIAGFALSVAVSAQAMTPAPIVQPDSMITEVAAACGVGRTRVNGVCVARTTVRQTRRAVRRCATGMTC